MKSRAREARGRARTAALRVVVTDARGREIRTGPAKGLGVWLAQSAPAGTAGTVAVAVVTDSVMQRLNRDFRSKDRVTDVLSFPAGKPGAPRAERYLGRFLGDLAIARGQAARQAREYGHPLGVELRVLALHGLLHLLGYDHDTDRGEMARLEDRLRRRAGLPSGLIKRKPARHT